VRPPGRLASPTWFNAHFLTMMSFIARSFFASFALFRGRILANTLTSTPTSTLSWPTACLSGRPVPRRSPRLRRR